MRPLISSPELQKINQKLRQHQGASVKVVGAE
jgi:hypothetical protein